MHLPQTMPELMMCGWSGWPGLLADLAPPPAEDIASYTWRFLPIGYAVTVCIELPILIFGLSRRHSRAKRILLGFWLTACTYPIVVLVLPQLLLRFGLLVYLAVAETFAPLAECLLFRTVDTLSPRDAPGSQKVTTVSANLTAPRQSRVRDYTVIVLANLASFLIGLVLTSRGMF